MVTMLAYVRYAERPTLYRYLFLFLLFMLGQLAKPMLVTLPFVLLLLDYWPLGRLRMGQWRGLFRLVWEKIPLFILAALSIYISILSHQHQGILQSTKSVPMMLRMENALVSYVSYISKIVWPRNLAVFYPFPDAIPLWQAAGALLVLVCISLALLLKLRHIPSLGTGWLWFLGTSVPTIGLVQGGLWPKMADRWAYIPAIGIFIIVVWGGGHLFKKWRCRKWLSVAVSLALLLILMMTTWLQTHYWANSISLFEHTLAVAEGSYMAHSNLGNALARRGRLDEAILHYSEALRISPFKAVEIHNNLGAALIVKGRFKEAIPHLRYALEKMPNHASAKKNLQLALEGLEREGAIKKPTNQALIIPRIQIAKKTAQVAIHLKLGRFREVHPFGLFRRPDAMKAITDAIHPKNPVSAATLQKTSGPFTRGWFKMAPFRTPFPLSE
jgi:tetratricopeptide (TPR) repeat protein